MKSVTHTYSILFASLIFLLMYSCKNRETGHAQPTSEIDELGKINLVVTGNPMAQKEFQTGLLLLHNFEYDDARTYFEKAIQLDSAMAMAYWGAAMSHNHSLWQKQDKEAALDILNKLAPNPKERQRKTQTDLERDFLNSIEILYGEGTKTERDIAYKDYLNELHKKYPENNEIAAFYAIALLGASRNGRDAELYETSAEISKSILAQNNQHPGALHYLIHAYDDPKHAHFAKQAADNYSKVAADATHALHMPSHIYVALGDWNNVINSNIASWNASVNKNNKSYHALNWLQYGLLQKDKLNDAQNLVLKMKKNVDQDDSKSARSYYIGMLGAQLVETQNWEDTLTNYNFQIDDLNLVKQTQHHFIQGMKAYTLKNRNSLKNTIDHLEKIRYNASLSLGDKTYAMCSANGYASKPPNQLDLDMTQIMEWQLKARLAFLLNKNEQGLSMLKKAAALDETLSYSYGPPLILKPIAEDFAEFSLKLKKYNEALIAFDKSLLRNPKRILSLKGKLSTLSHLDQKDMTNKVKNEIDDVLMPLVTKEIL